ncbi:lytic murein transglycosylase [Gimibacter soli]|uniref:Lytic murein transglycosylase n=1 Tax=Gimibacter soli TaxID=3024400 RepID=A0AAE9XL28_9PROT|nr:lytic murein transglycosylase [Gimibacter soli]WCL52868.1 lytic murein transglycosylase [Gimibacter soli]
MQSFKGLAAALMLATTMSAPSLGNDSAEAKTPAQDPAFTEWLAGVRSEALSRGIGEATLDNVLPGISPIERVIKSDKAQPEFKETYATYLQKRVSDWRKTKGGEMVVEHADALAAAQGKYGVQGRVIAAIWGIETNYGTIPLTYSAFDTIATLAYDKRRADRFRRELFAALEIVDRGYADLDEMKSSWAGALGQPQFMPEAYLRFAVDMDGDGHRNIWTSHADVFGSIAHYLNMNGWKGNETWGRPVRLPKKGGADLVGQQADGVTPPAHCKAYKTLGGWRSLADWQAAGIRRLSGDDLPAVDIAAALVVGDEEDDQAYLVYGNFCSIMRYNPAFRYALAVGLLSDTFK